MNELTISVITPSYNQGKYIERTIQSVLNQKITNLEYVIFDGDSNDNTLTILKKFQSQISWVSEKDNGQADAVNKGIKSTTGDIIAWLNSDDIYYDGSLKEVLSYFHKNPHIDVVYGLANHINTEDKIIEPYPVEKWDPERLSEICYLCQPAVFFRRRITDSAGLLDPNLTYCMDYEFWLRLAQNGASFAFLKNVLAGSRLYPETKTMSARVAVHKEINNMLKAKLGFVPNRWLIGYAQVILNAKKITPTHNRALFALLAIPLIIFASVKWNKKISLDLVRHIYTWIKQGASKHFNQPNL